MAIESEVVAAIRKHLDAAKKEAVQINKEVTPTYNGPAIPSEPLPLSSGHMFSDVFCYVPSFGDFPVKRLEDSEDEEVRRLVPSIDMDYVVQKEEAAVLVASLQDGDKTLVTGPTGSGKSSLVRYVAAKLNYPFIRINMSGDVESGHIFGTREVKDGATTWADGPLAEAVKCGAIVLIDEWELMPAEIAMGMQNLLESDGYLYLKEKPGTSADRTYMPHENFRMVFAGNTTGQGDTTGAFNGVQVQNTATIDRFTSTIHLDYLSAEHEIAYITSKTKASAEVAKDMVQFASLIRAGYSSDKLPLTMSPRTLLNWGKKMERYSIRGALEVAFIKKLGDDDRAAVEELYGKVFPA